MHGRRGRIRTDVAFAVSLPSPSPPLTFDAKGGLFAALGNPFASASFAASLPKVHAAGPPNRLCLRDAPRSHNTPIVQINTVLSSKPRFPFHARVRYLNSVRGVGSDIYCRRF